MKTSTRSPLLARRSGSSAGFSLVELMVAAGIIVITVAGFYATFGGINEYATRSRLVNSAKVHLGAALNEALGGRWTFSSSPRVQQLGDWDKFSTQNEGLNAKPTPRGDGEVSLFTTADNALVVPGILERRCYQHPVRSDMRVVQFRIRYQYRGVWSPYLEAQTCITRTD